jgi:hypothetical protein
MGGEFEKVGNESTLSWFSDSATLGLLERGYYKFAICDAGYYKWRTINFDTGSRVFRTVREAGRAPLLETVGDMPNVIDEGSRLIIEGSRAALEAAKKALDGLKLH